MPLSPPFKAAILVNSPGTDPIDTAFRHAFHERITSASPGAQVDFFDPIQAQTYPETGQYDLIVLTGGGGSADADARGVAWVEKLKGFVRGVAQEGGQKVVGVCWGHQVVQVAFGGAVGGVGEGGFEIGVHDLTLTNTGSSFFSPTTAHPPSSSPPEQLSSLSIHQFHSRCVTTPGNGFLALAENNQCLINRTNTMLTFQGHPEMDAELSKQLLDVSPGYSCGADGARRQMERAHDGGLVWERIVAWARGL